MGKRSISDTEIGLIKAMLRRGMKNQAIQFLFNTPDRPVNSGRVTQIRQGTYGGNIPEATTAALDAFLNSRGSGSAPAPLPVDREGEVRGMFGRSGPYWGLRSGENDQVECKREIDVRKLAPLVRAIAAMANNRGGLIFVGVENHTGKVVGLPNNAFEKMDLVKVTNAVKAHLQPTPSFTKGILHFGSLRVGYLDVAPHEDRPVVVYRQGDRLEDGAILFRYPAESANIKFGDLRTLLDDRDARRLRALAQITQRVAEIGPENAAVLSTTDGTLSVGNRPLLVDPALLARVKIIQEGRFDEIDGDPTLKLVGEITTASGDSVTGRGVITDEDFLRNFLDQQIAFAPIEYVRWAATTTTRDWLPIFYFGRQAGLTGTNLAGLIATFDTTRPKRRADLIARAEGTRSAYEKLSGSPAKCLAEILAGRQQHPTTVKEAEHIAMALRGLPRRDAPAKADLLSLLQAASHTLKSAERWNAISYVYRAAARLDEVYFRDD